MWLFIGLPVLAIFVMSVIHASSTLQNIKLHWNEYRCNPMYIPFAGAVRPEIGVQANFQHCMGMMAQDVFRGITDGIMSLFKQLTSGLTQLMEPLGSIRGILSKIRKSLLSFAIQTFGKITNTASSITFILIKIRDVLNRFVGEGWIAVFLMNTLIDSIVSFVMLCISIIKTFVYALLAISIILAMFQPGLLVFAIIIASLLGSAGFL